MKKQNEHVIYSLPELKDNFKKDLNQGMNKQLDKINESELAEKAKDLMKYYRLMAMIGLLFFSFSCEDTGETEENLGYTALVKLAWGEFNKDLFERSKTSFNRAITLEKDSSAAHSGLAWVLLTTDEISEAKKEFYLANTATIDVQAGLAFYLNTQKEFSESNEYVNSVLNSNEKWDLYENIKYNYKHLLLLKAENFYQLANFTEAYTAIQRIDSSITITEDLSTYEGQKKLAEEIERLQAEI